MGSKKKARAKQRQAAKATTPAESQAPPAAAVGTGTLVQWRMAGMMGMQQMVKAKIMSHSFHPNDKVDELCEYMMAKSRVDFKVLSQHLPHFAQKIREKAIEETDAVRSITMELLKRYPGLLGEVNYHTFLRLHFDKIIEHAVGFIPNYKALLGADYERAYEAFLDATTNGISNKPGTSLELCLEYSDVTHEAILSFEDVFDRKLFGHVKGEFRRQFNRKKRDHIRNLGGLGEFAPYAKLQIDILASIQAIALCVLDAGKCCWECDHVPDSSLLMCSVCNFASYCSKNCQKKAWGTRHKMTCACLAMRRNKLEKDIGTIEEQYDSNGKSLSCGSKNRRILSDYYCLVNIIATERVLEAINLGAPSMTMFYRNLDLVADGQLWVIQDALSVEKYRSSGVPDQEENIVFIHIASLLAYDLQTLTEFSDIYTKLVGLGLPASKMPAEYFVRIYNEVRPHGIALLDDENLNMKRKRRYLVKHAEDRLRSLYDRGISTVPFLPYV